jgi:drug/metabolite transporter (DMT)-like permease
VRRSVGIALYALLCVIWGSTWLVIKIGYGGLGPFNVAALRFFLAALVLAPLVPMLGARWPAGRIEWMLVVVVGVALFAADYGLIYWGEQYIDSGLTAILFATLPLVTLLFAHAYVPGERITARKLAGTLVAFIGVVALFAGSVRIDPGAALPMTAIVAAAVFAAVSSVASKRHGHALHPAALNAPAMVLGAAVLMVASFVNGDGFALPRDARTWAAIGYLAIAGSVVTFLIYFSLLKTWSVTSLSFISVFIPIVAIVLGFAFRGERLTGLMVVGTALILGGVAFALTAASGSQEGR